MKDILQLDLEKACHEVQILARKTGQFINDESAKISQGNIEVKGTHNFVTYVDKAAEEKLVEGLQIIIPDSGFITEEETIQTSQRNYTWVIDPLDGTTNFIHSLPCFSISIGLLRNNEIVMGVVYDINLDECFYAWEGSKAFLNGREISVSGAMTLNDSLLATGFPYYDYSRLEKYMELFTWCLRNTHGVRRIGSAAIDLAWVACGRFEAFFEYGLNPWDVVGGAFIVQQAGGKVSDFSGGKNYIFGRELVASNGAIHAEFLNQVDKVFVP